MTSATGYYLLHGGPENWVDRRPTSFPGMMIANCKYLSSLVGGVSSFAILYKFLVASFDS